MFSLPTTSIGIDDEIWDSMNESRRRLTSEWSAEVIVAEAVSFENSLDMDHEIGARLASFGASIAIHIRSIRPIDPNLIVFEGVTDDGAVTRLIQHMNQLNVLFISVKKLGPEPHRVKMGFVDFEPSKPGSCP